MTIDRLNEETILVTLARDEMERYSLDFGAGDDTTRRGLRQLMLRIGHECGLNHSGKSYLIEALPAGGSCLLIISVRPLSRRRTYRIKRVEKRECFRFDGIDALLDWSRVGAVFRGELYTYEDGCWLLPDCPPAPAVRRALTEYASPRELSAVMLARIREHGTPIGGCSPRRPLRRRTVPRGGG